MRLSVVMPVFNERATVVTTVRRVRDIAIPVFGWKDGTVAPLLLVLFAFVVAALPPLHEMDLAQHLAGGEWIVRHRAVPFTEPFAWTRAGQPYFAYSWVPQVLFYSLLALVGPLGLHLLEGVLVGGSVAAALWAARQFGWRRVTSLILGVLYLALVWGVTGTIRPQQFLFIAVPLVWGIAARIRNRGLSAGRLLALAGLGVYASNVHIFFPLTAVPIAFFLLTDGNIRRWIPAAAALVGGWLVNPYALVFPQVFALNFGHNVLLGRPTSIMEFVPGFEYSIQRPGVIAAVVALLAVPWLLLQQRNVRARVVGALFWLGGLLLFAYAGRLVFAWWTLAFALVGEAAEHLTTVVVDLLRRPLRRVAVTGLAAVLLIAAAPSVSPVFWLFEGDTVHRMLPRAGEDPGLWLPSWLLCHTHAGATGKVFTEFNYGSELNWRLPGYSPSIDGRTIFPDSDAVEFSFYSHGHRRQHASTWMRADLALLDRTFWLAPVLDQDNAWLLVAQSRRTSRGRMVGLWAKREWWLRWGTPTPLPALDIRVGDPRGTCPVTGVFPKL